MYNPNLKPDGLVKQISFACVIMLLLASCLGPRKIDKWVNKQYEETVTTQPKKSNDYITVTEGANPADNRASTTTNKTSHLLPLIFYWQFDYKNTCVLNNKIPINNFTSTVITYANKKGLKQKLDGRKVELSVTKIPNTFAIDDKGHVIFLIVHAISWDILTIQPENTDMVVTYRVLQGDAEIKKGKITIADINKKVALKMFQSTKKRTWSYLDQYDTNIATMSKLVIDKLMTEL